MFLIRWKEQLPLKWLHDMEIDSLVASKLTLDNSSYYIEMNNVTADVVEIASSWRCETV